MSPKPMDGQLLALALALMSPTAVVAEPGPRIENPPQETQQIYGSQWMSPQERREYSLKISGLQTREEQEAFRLQHRQKMQLRAKTKKISPAANPTPNHPPVSPNAQP